MYRNVRERTWRLACGIGLCLIVGLCSTDAAARWQTTKAITKARQALSLGLLKKWKEALLQGDALFAKERKQMSLQERTNAAMWLRLLWAKYYQYAGALPSIRDVGSFEDKKALQQFTREFAKAISYLRLALDHLRRYNGLYTQAMDRTKVRSQVYLQASLSLARDLEERIRSGKIYVAFLRYAATHWGDKKKIQKRLDSQLQKLRTNKQNLEKMVRKQLSLEKQQRKLATSVEQAQGLFAKYEARAARQRATSITLITLGSILTAGGLGGAGFAVYKYTEDQHVIDCNKLLVPCKDPSLLYSTTGSGPDDFQRFQQDSQQQLALIFGLSGGGVAIGVTLIIVGWAIGPSAADANKALIKSHNKHLEYERKQGIKRRKTSAITPSQKAFRRVASLPANTHLLGQW